jgi:hypothetical protein
MTKSDLLNSNSIDDEFEYENDSSDSEILEEMGKTLVRKILKVGRCH